MKDDVPDRPYSERLKLLAAALFHTGLFGFGGPLATMAMMRSELIEKRKLVTPARYLEGLGAVKLLPGPVSSLLAVFLGQEIAGTLGGVVAVSLFILPSFCMLLAIAYFESSVAEQLATPAAQGLLQALQAAVIAVILYNCYKLFIDAYKRVYAGERRPVAVAGFAIVSAVAAWVRAPELAILLSCAGLGVFLLRRLRAGARLGIEPLTIFLVFFKAGLTVFGTGYMVLPYLQRTLVDERGWLTTAAFLDAVTYGNLTPGPVVIASTHMGFKMAGLSGALAATIGIFIGPVVLMLLLGGWIRKLLGKPWVEGALLGLLPAVAATIAVSLTALARGITWGPVNVGVSIVAFGLLTWARAPAWAVLLGSGAAGLLIAIGFG